MKRTILTTCLALACSAALLSAQTPQSNTGSSQSDRNSTSPSQTDRSSSKADRSSSKGGSVTLTGCLQAGTEPNTFTLNNVSESGSQSSSSKSNHPSTSSTPSEMARADSSYILVPNNKKVDLSKHIGQRVEVTGTLISESGGMHSSQGSMGRSSSEGSSGSSSSSSTSSSSGTSSGSMGGHSGMSSSDMSGNAHQLKVRSIRQIASSCQ